MFLLMLVEMNSLAVGVTHTAEECLALFKEIESEFSVLFSSSRGSHAADENTAA